MAKEPLSQDELFDPDVINRFVNQLKIGEKPQHLETACVEWAGSKNSDGYGVISVGSRENQHKILTHRYAMQLTFGGIVIEPEIKICHKCDNPACVVPTHLFPDTHQGNMDDMVKKNRAAISFGNAKTNWDVVDDIRSSNLTNKELCQKHNLPKATVSEIRRGKIWKEEHRNKALLPD